MSDRKKLILFLLAVLLAAGWAGTIDLEDAQRDERVYCERVVVGEIEPYLENVDCSEVLAR